MPIAATHDEARSTAPDEQDDLCSACLSRATMQLTATTFACSAACEARIAEQWCSACGSWIAEGEDHASDCPRNEEIAAEEYVDDARVSL